MCLDGVGQQLGGDSVQISVRCYHRGGSGKGYTGALCVLSYSCRGTYNCLKIKSLIKKMIILGISLVIQWLGFHSHCRGHSEFPGRGTQVPQAVWYGKKK